MSPSRPTAASAARAPLLITPEIVAKYEAQWPWLDTSNLRKYVRYVSEQPSIHRMIGYWSLENHADVADIVREWPENPLTKWEANFKHQNWRGKYVPGVRRLLQEHGFLENEVDGYYFSAEQPSAAAAAVIEQISEGTIPMLAWAAAPLGRLEVLRLEEKKKEFHRTREFTRPYLGNGPKERVALGTRQHQRWVTAYYSAWNEARRAADAAVAAGAK